MKELIFVPSDEDKEKAIAICGKVIDLFENEPFEFKAWCMQMLLDSFEENYDCDIRNSISIGSDKK